MLDDPELRRLNVSPEQYAAVIDKLAKEDVEKDRGAVASNNSALNLAGELRHDLESGTADPAKLKKAQELANKLRVQLAQQGDDLGSGGSGFATAGGAIDTLLNPKAAQALAQKQYADQARAFLAALDRVLSSLYT